jgi:pantetheine-phosphate adenylyltransferase
MLFTSTLLLVEGADPHRLSALYTSVINKALYNTMANGSLDVLVMKCPNHISAVQTVVSGFYNIARAQALELHRTSIRVRVLLDGQNVELARHQNWEVVTAGKFEEDLITEFRYQVPESSQLLGLPVVIFRMDRGDEHEQNGYTQEQPAAQTIGNGSTDPSVGQPDAGEWEHDVVAVGGTFDHLHDGHKLLLTIAGFLAKEKLIVGITGSELLVNKKYAEAMEPYMKRRNNVEEFVQYLYPALEVESHMLHDVAGPTGTIEDIDALVLSSETRKGGEAVNKLRQNKGWHPLVVYEVDVIGCETGSEADNWSDKLSSTELRRLELEKLRIV